MAKVIAQQERPMRKPGGKVYFFQSHFATAERATDWKDIVLMETWLAEWWYKWQIIEERRDYYNVKVWYQRHSGIYSAEYE